MQTESKPVSGMIYWRMTSSNQTREVREETERPNFAGAGTHHTTDIESSVETIPLSEVDIPEGQRQFELKNKEQQNSINAVVSKVDENSVFLKCQLPDRNLEISFARGYIDRELAIYGTPVSLTLQEIQGIRRPVIKFRVIEEKENTNEVKELEDWIKKIEE